MHAMAITYSFIRTLLSHKPRTSYLSESRRTTVGECLLVAAAGAVGKRELEVLGKELLDVGAADGLGVVNLNNLDNLHRLSVKKNFMSGSEFQHTLMEPKRARWRAAMSW